MKYPDHSAKSAGSLQAAGRKAKSRTFSRFESRQLFSKAFLAEIYPVILLIEYSSAMLFA